MRRAHPLRSLSGINKSTFNRLSLQPMTLSFRVWPLCESSNSSAMRSDIVVGNGAAAPSRSLPATCTTDSPFCRTENGPMVREDVHPEASPIHTVATTSRSRFMPPPSCALRGVRSSPPPWPTCSGSYSGAALPTVPTTTGFCAAGEKDRQAVGRPQIVRPKTGASTGGRGAPAVEPVSINAKRLLL